MIDWINSDDIAPYIYMRKENLFEMPGSYLKDCDWFKKKPIYKNPLRMDEVAFGDQILNLETKAFQKASLQMPRWVFYDCAIIPGFVCGFAQKTKTLSESFCRDVGVNTDLEWTPLSLFIIIPTIRQGEWVAHNLCSANSLVSDKDKKYALGFLSKAFGLWYANVEVLCGITQWQSPAIRLHSHYGPFEILTAYTPIHTIARTLTYRSRLNFNYWQSFFDSKNAPITTNYQYSGITIDPKNDESLKSLQRQIEEEKKKVFYLKSHEIRTQDLDAPLKIYHI
ncbi:MAG: hypothetical protein A2Z20_08475 [Bdellovibrionales bacterium RBG_16_40_8]|nr:MAG: hypothetical protein A2Z20_08475 [Bdellovibrionales bacterium RBG_16_40_8]